MSYDLYLRDPVTNEVARVPGHLMYGGTYRADYHPETDEFTPALSTDASLNITYNYAPYYYEVKPELGIRSLYGSTGLESIKILDEMITILLEKYKDGEEWVTTRRMEKQCFDMAGNQVEDPIYAFEHHIDVEMREIEVERYEGHNPNYWKPTAANAVKPLYQLKSLAQMRPDCIWEGD